MWWWRPASAWWRGWPSASRPSGRCSTGSAARALGLPPGQIVFLDDMPWNVEAAVQAGMLAVRVPPDRAGPAVDAARDLLGLPPARAAG